MWRTGCDGSELTTTKLDEAAIEGHRMVGNKSRLERGTREKSKLEMTAGRLIDSE